MFSACSSHVFSMFLPCFQHVLVMFSSCSCHVFSMFLSCFQHVLVMFSACSCHVFQVHFVLEWCLFCVLFMFLSRLLCVGRWWRVFDTFWARAALLNSMPSCLLLTQAITILSFTAWTVTNVHASESSVPFARCDLLWIPQYSAREGPSRL